MLSLPVIKLITQVAASIGVTKIVADVVKNNVAVLTRIDAIKVWTGSAVLGSMLVEQSANHIDRMVDGVVAGWKERNELDEPEDEDTVENTEDLTEES